MTTYPISNVTVIVCTPISEAAVSGKVANGTECCWGCQPNVAVHIECLIHGADYVDAVFLANLADLIRADREIPLDLGPHDLVEVRMTDCPFGCKVYRCDGCGYEVIIHLMAYGHTSETWVPVKPVNSDNTDNSFAEYVETGTFLETDGLPAVEFPDMDVFDIVDSDVFFACSDLEHYVPRAARKGVNHRRTLGLFA